MYMSVMRFDNTSKYSNVTNISSLLSYTMNEIYDKQGNEVDLNVHMN